jgi:hypothetical protein
MSRPTLDWEKLKAEYPPEVIQELRRYLDEAGPLALTTDDLTAAAVEVGPEVALTLLRKVVSLGGLKEERRFACPNCPETLTVDELNAGTCPHCDYDLNSSAVRPEEVFVFVRESAPSRDVRWVLSLHGMNTRGGWQEEFNWLVSTSYAHAVPVAMYKYGIVRPGAFFRFRHVSMARDLASKIKRLVGTTERTGFGKRPDVIAHSLGTLLLNLALRMDRSVEVGRVILMGSIIRPDFDWRDLIATGQVQAVLNHYGTKDFWALIAHYFIPGSGPSGRVGFNDDKSTIDVAATGLGHSSFFDPHHLNDLFATLWRPFLTLPPEQLSMLSGLKDNKRDWREAWWPLRAVLPRFVVVGISCIVGSALLLALFAGLFQIVNWLRLSLR